MVENLDADAAHAVFHLRPDVRFHDGHLFESRDVKFTYEANMNPKNISPRLSDFEPVKEVEIIDPLTVRIVYKRLYSLALGTWGMGMLPEHLLRDEALKKEAVQSGKNPEQFSMRDSRFNRRPIGCGPFLFNEWKSDQYIALDRYNDYWEGPPHYHQYFYRIIPDLLTQEMEFYAGTVDAYAVRPASSTVVPTTPATIKVILETESRSNIFGLPLSAAAFRDIERPIGHLPRSSYVVSGVQGGA